MDDIIIKAEGLSKSYIIGHEHRDRYIALRDVISNTFRNSWAKTKHLFKGGQLIPGNELEEFWALKDINFEVHRGDRIGIIGKNGAGKSTLLKVLSRITEPTKGKVYISGRVASLLEVGTGFHPELTGKENIFLNGAILGMKRWEIKKKFDEIVNFSGIEKFLDTPVKRYSSGMYVRLAFAVAAHLEPEILIVDEVLAVGDAEFQKKCLGKMGEVSKEEGRTVLFVSHNMLAVKTLCASGILLKDGSIEFAGEIERVVDFYLSDSTAKSIKNNFWKLEDAPGNNYIKVRSAFITYENDRITVKSSFDIITEFWNLCENVKINVSMVIWDINQNPVFNISTNSILLKKGLNKAVFHIPENLLNDGIYRIQNHFVMYSSTPVFIHDDACTFEIFEDRISSGWHGKWIGAVRPTFIKSDLYPICLDAKNAQNE